MEKEGDTAAKMLIPLNRITKASENTQRAQDAVTTLGSCILSPAELGEDTFDL